MELDIVKLVDFNIVIDDMAKAGMITFDNAIAVKSVLSDLYLSEED